MPSQIIEWEEGGVKIIVDPAKCDGHGLCALTAPSVFAVDESGYVELLDPTPDISQTELVDEAVDCCPTQALSVEY
jgi:ferredoxin